MFLHSDHSELGAFILSCVPQYLLMVNTTDTQNNTQYLLTTHSSTVAMSKDEAQLPFHLQFCQSSGIGMPLQTFAVSNTPPSVVFIEVNKNDLTRSPAGFVEAQLIVLDVVANRLRPTARQTRSA